MASLISLGASLLCAELAVRWWLPELGMRPFLDSHLGWASEEYLRLDPGRYKTGGHRTRLLVLGDSYLASSYCERGQDVRFPALLARELPDQLETLTLSTSGWGTDQQLMAFLEKGRPWRPGHVLLAFCANNDLSDILSITHGRGSRKPFFRLGDDGELALFDSAGAPLETGPEGLSGGARFRSQLLDLLKSKWARARGDPAPNVDVDPRYLHFTGIEPPRMKEVYELGPELGWSPQLTVSSVSAYIAEDFELNRYQWDLLAAIVEQLRDRTEAAGAELTVLLLPMVYRPRDLRFSTASELSHRFDTPAGPFTFQMKEPGRRLEAIAGELGVRFLDPSAEFFAIVRDRALEEQVWPDPHNRHFGPLGHRILARILSDFVRDELRGGPPK
jgi:hypothetical protein